jgi:hypothetical protein
LISASAFAKDLVRIGVVTDAMAFGEDTAGELRVRLAIAADQEKGRAHAFGL